MNFKQVFLFWKCFQFCTYYAITIFKDLHSDFHHKLQCVQSFIPYFKFYIFLNDYLWVLVICIYFFTFAKNHFIDSSLLDLTKELNLKDAIFFSTFGWLKIQVFINYNFSCTRFCACKTAKKWTFMLLITTLYVGRNYTKLVLKLLAGKSSFSISVMCIAPFL